METTTRYIMNDTTEWHLSSTPGAPGKTTLRVICGGKVILLRVIDDHDRKQLSHMFNR